MRRRICIAVFLSGLILGVTLTSLFEVFPPFRGASAGAASPSGAKTMDNHGWEEAPDPAVLPSMCTPDAGLCLGRPD